MLSSLKIFSIVKNILLQICLDFSKIHRPRIILLATSLAKPQFNKSYISWHNY